MSIGLAGCVNELCAPNEMLLLLFALGGNVVFDVDDRLLFNEFGFDPTADVLGLVELAGNECVCDSPMLPTRMW